MVQKIRLESNLKKMRELPIYIFIFFIFFFFKKYPYQKIEKKSCNRAKIKKMLLIYCLFANYSRTIFARFAHDLFKIALHDFFYKLCKIVRKIVRLLVSDNHIHMNVFSTFCTKAQFFSAHSSGGYLNSVILSLTISKYIAAWKG